MFPPFRFGVVTETSKTFLGVSHLKALPGAITTAEQGLFFVLSGGVESRHAASLTGNSHLPGKSRMMGQ